MSDGLRNLLNQSSEYFNHSSEYVMSFLGGDIFVLDEDSSNINDEDEEHPLETTETLVEEKKRPVPNLLRRTMREDNLKFNPPRGGLRRFSNKDNIIFIKDKTLLDGSDEMDPETEDTFLLLSKADKRTSRRYSMENNFALFKEEPTMNVVKINEDSEEESHDGCSAQSNASEVNDFKDRTKNPFWVVYNIKKFQRNVEHSKLAHEDKNVNKNNSNSETSFDEEKIPVWIAQKLQKRFSRTETTNEENSSAEAKADETELPEVFEGDNNFVMKDGLIEYAPSQCAKSKKQFFLFKKIPKPMQGDQKLPKLLDSFMLFFVFMISYIFFYSI